MIDTGANTVSNSGILEATGSGGLTIHSDVANSGLLWANGGNITIDGAVSGNGTVDIEGQATFEFGAASSANAMFGPGAAGTIKLDDSADFTGTVSGFGADDRIDLSDIAFATGVTTNYLANQGGTGGTLVVSNGTTTANIAFMGQYQSADFHAASDNDGGTVVSYAPSQAAAPFDFGGNHASANVIGGAENDQITGSPNNDTIVSGSTSQTLTGGGGADNFVFRASIGNDTVTDYTPGTDQFYIDHTLFADVTALVAATHDVNGSAVITHDATQSIALTGVSAAQVAAHQNDFHIV